MNFCNFIQQRLRADDFQMPPHRQAVSVVRHLLRHLLTFILIVSFNVSYGQDFAYPSIKAKGQSFADLYPSDQVHLDNLRISFHERVVFLFCVPRTKAMTCDTIGINNYSILLYIFREIIFIQLISTYQTNLIFIGLYHRFRGKF